MNKVEFNEHYELEINGEVVSLEQVFCALMRRTATIDGIGPNSPKHWQHTLEILADQFDEYSEFLRNEKTKHRYNGGQR